MTNPTPVDVTDQIARAFERDYDPSHRRDLRRRAASEDGYGAFDVSMCAGWVSDYRDLFDFFVNLPGTKKPDALREHAWRRLEPNLSIEAFLELRNSQLRPLLELVGADERIREGYVVSYEQGRLDEITTTSRTKFLLATDRSFVFVDAYDTTIH